MIRGNKIKIDVDQKIITDKSIQIKNQLIKDKIKPEVMILILIDAITNICEENQIDVSFIDSQEGSSLN